MDNRLHIRPGMPSFQFMAEAWRDEPLTVALPGIRYDVAFAQPDPEISLVAEENGRTVGQCSAQPIMRSWQHSERINPLILDRSTSVVCKLQARVVEVEKRYVEDQGYEAEKAMRSAGIAVIPSKRGQGIGKSMRERQIEVAKENGMKTLWSETTNRYSAATITPFEPDVVVRFPYKDLAVELNEPRLAKIDDSFTVYCKKV